MQVITQSYKIITKEPRQFLETAEFAGRTCYMSRDQIAEGSCSKFIKKLNYVYKHKSVLEHSLLSVHFIMARVQAQSLERHRLCAFAETSTRYVNYSKKVGVRFVRPISFKSPRSEEIWTQACKDSESSYLQLIKEEEPPEVARDVLGLCVATELVVSANWRQWQHIITMRDDEHAHPSIRALIGGLNVELKRILPEVFEQPPDPYIGFDEFVRQTGSHANTFHLFKAKGLFGEAMELTELGKSYYNPERGWKRTVINLLLEGAQ